MRGGGPLRQAESNWSRVFQSGGKTVLVGCAPSIENFFSGTGGYISRRGDAHVLSTRLGFVLGRTGCPAYGIGVRFSIRLVGRGSSASPLLRVRMSSAFTPSRTLRTRRSERWVSAAI